MGRACPLPINKDTTLEAQSWILHTRIAEEIAAASRYHVVVCDRSALDNYAYLVHQVGRRAEYDALVRERISGFPTTAWIPETGTGGWTWWWRRWGSPFSHPRWISSRNGSGASDAWWPIPVRPTAGERSSCCLSTWLSV